MIVTLFKRKGGVRKSTLAPHLAGQWARQGTRNALIDADPEGLHGRLGEARRSPALRSLARRHWPCASPPDRAVAGLAGHSDPIIIAGPLHVVDFLCSGLLGAASLSPTRCVTYPYANFPDTHGERS
jgi:chromosome partitioning protein